MTCFKCNGEGVLNTVLNKDFWYCRTCKEEIFLSSVEYTDSEINTMSDISDKDEEELQLWLDLAYSQVDFAYWSSLTPRTKANI
jgi:hypothetical protein